MPRWRVLPLVLLIFACAPGTQSPGPLQAEKTPNWLTMEVRYSSRHSLGQRRLDILTTNGGPSEIVVTEIGLRADHFVLVPPESKNSRIEVGTTVAVKADFGEVTSCTPGGDAAVAITLMIDGEPKSHLFQVDAQPLARIREVECSERMVREAVEVRFADGWFVEGTTLSTDLMITPRRKEIPITLEAVGGMILFAMEASGSPEVPLSVLEVGSAAVSMPVEISLVRCDVHAVSQAPDGYAFRAWLGVDGSEPFAITVLAEDSLQAQLEQMVNDCLAL